MLPVMITIMMKEAVRPMESPYMELTKVKALISVWHQFSSEDCHTLLTPSGASALKSVCIFKNLSDTASANV